MPGFSIWKPSTPQPRPGAHHPVPIEVVDVPEPSAGAAERKRSDIPVENDHLAAVEDAVCDAGIAHAEDDRRGAVVIDRRRIARGRVDRHADGVDRRIVGDRLAILEQRRQREDRHARRGRRTSASISWLASAAGIVARKAAISSTGRMRVGAGRRVEDLEAQLGQMRGAPEMVLRRHARRASTPRRSSRRNPAASARSPRKTRRSDSLRRAPLRRSEPDDIFVLGRRVACDRSTRSRHERHWATGSRRTSD